MRVSTVNPASASAAGVDLGRLAVAWAQPLPPSGVSLPAALQIRQPAPLVPAIGHAWC